MKKVWLLGDSIRGSYTARVGELLDGRAKICSPADNGRFVRYTQWMIHHTYYPEFKDPDIVHWNNGIWDLHYLASMDSAFTTPEEYKRDLERMIVTLCRMVTTDKIIWASTTPVADGFTACKNDEIVEYNKIAAEIMAKHGIEVNDLHGIIDADRDGLIAEDKLHLSAKGVEAAAQSVVKYIEKRL